MREEKQDILHTVPQHQCSETAQKYKIKEAKANHTTHQRQLKDTKAHQNMYNSRIISKTDHTQINDTLERRAATVQLLNIRHLHSEHGPEAPASNLEHHEERVRAVGREAQRPEKAQNGVDDDHKVVEPLHLVKVQLLAQKGLLTVELQQLVVYDYVPPAGVDRGCNVQRNVPAHVLRTERALWWERAK